MADRRQVTSKFESTHSALRVSSRITIEITDLGVGRNLLGTNLKQKAFPVVREKKRRPRNEGTEKRWIFLVTQSKCEPRTKTLPANPKENAGLLPYLEPCHILLVVPPRLLFQLACGEVLLVRPLLVVEDEEQRVRVEFVEHVRLLEGWSGLTRKGHRRSVGVTRSIPERIRDVIERVRRCTPGGG